MPQIVLDVSDKQLKKLVKAAKSQEFEVLDSTKLLTILLQKKVDDLEVFFDEVTDGGGVELIGDVLRLKEAKGVVRSLI